MTCKDCPKYKECRDTFAELNFKALDLTDKRKFSAAIFKVIYKFCRKRDE